MVNNLTREPDREDAIMKQLLNARRVGRRRRNGEEAVGGVDALWGEDAL